MPEKLDRCVKQVTRQPGKSESDAWAIRRSSIEDNESLARNRYIVRVHVSNWGWLQVKTTAPDDQTALSALIDIVWNRNPVGDNGVALRNDYSGKMEFAQHIKHNISRGYGEIKYVGQVELDLRSVDVE